MKSIVWGPFTLGAFYRIAIEDSHDDAVSWPELGAEVHAVYAGRFRRHYRLHFVPVAVRCWAGRQLKQGEKRMMNFRPLLIFHIEACAGLNIQSSCSYFN